MHKRFISFLSIARWTSAVVALMYHARFLLFVDYDAVQARTLFSKGFYFLTGLGHESFAVYFVIDGILAGLILLRGRAGDPAERGPVLRHVGALYRILLPGLLLGASLDLVGARCFNGSGLYTAFPAFSTLSLSYSSLLGNVFMLQPFVVPTFGSNGMLYLLSYLYWSFILLFLLVHATRLDQPRARQVLPALLLAAVLLIMPAQFLAWAATWLAGVAVVALGAARLARPPVLAGLVLFGAALLVSRLAGADTGLLAPPFGAWLIQCKYLLVGIGFAVLAWSLYPAEPPLRAVGVADGRAGQAAAFAFFCHFPVLMLLVAVATTLGQPLMQQPTPARYAGFAGLVGACLLLTALVARATRFTIKAMAPKRWRRDDVQASGS